MAAKKRARGYNQLKKALIGNLSARGFVETMYVDKVQEYMDLWQRRQELKADIDERGIAITDTKRGMKVENRSVSLEVQVSRQMLAIYTALGFKDLALNTLEDSAGGEDDEL